MYIPAWFRIDDENEIQRIIRENPFATLVSVIDGEPFATHLPILADPNDPNRLIGHLAVQNPHAPAFDSDQTHLVMFHGPHAYISPTFYESSPNVPTWNYAVVHAYGKIVPLDDPEQAIDCLRLIVERFDPDLSNTRPESTDEAYWRKMLKGIRAFSMSVVRFEAKAKANQNKSESDVDSVICELESSSDLANNAMASFMRTSNSR